MATQYTSILKLALPTQGELSGTWGNVVNDNITSMVEEAIAGRAVIDSWVANGHTLTTADGTTAEARCAMLEFTDTTTALTGNAEVICPTASKIYIAKNATGAGYSVTVKTSAGTGIAVPDGGTMFLFCDGTNVVEAITSVNTLVATQVDITAQGDLRLQDTTGGQYVALQAPGTIATSYTLTLPVDDGTNGQALTTDGSGVLSWADTGGVTGPVSSTDNAIARYDGTTGDLIQNSGVTIDDSNNVSGVGTLVTTGDATINGITVGEGAGSRDKNVAVGQSALTSNTTGCGNTAVGSNALCSNTASCCSTAVGSSALANSNTVFGYNTAVGASALFCNTTGGGNTAVGGFALLCTTTGANNTAVGDSALLKNTGTGNSALGWYALACNTTGASNTAVGSCALICNTTGL
jgi:hypothetical protein